MHGQAEHLPASWCEVRMAGGRFARPVFQGAEGPEQLFSPLDRLRIRLVEPVKLRGALDAERVQQQDYFRQIATLDFRRVALRPVQMPALRPKPVARARSRSSGASFSLFRRGAADLFDEQRADAAPGVVARDP